MSGKSEVELQLSESRTIAVVGMSPRPDRPSHHVAKYLMEQGYKVIPVNPAVDEVLGMKSYPDVVSIPERVDMVDIFRRSGQVPPVVEDAIAAGARFVWMQDGVVNEEAAAKARGAGDVRRHGQLHAEGAQPIYGASGID